MEFRFHLLALLVLAAPLIMFFVVYGVCKRLGNLAGNEAVPPPPSAKPRQTYFYPTREADGNGNDF